MIVSPHFFLAACVAVLTKRLSLGMHGRGLTGHCLLACLWPMHCARQLSGACSNSLMSALSAWQELPLVLQDHAAPEQCFFSVGCMSDPVTLNACNCAGSEASANEKCRR